jgi:CheY-like chemotaxis protein
MRPPKTILLIDSNEERRSVRAFALAVHGYRVTQAGSPKAVSKRSQFDLVIGVWPVGVFKAPYTSALLIYRKCEEKKALDLTVVDACMCDPSMADLLDRVKVLTARKRGPRPGSQGPMDVITQSAKNFHSNYPAPL